MNEKMLCSRCKKNPAVIFISKVDGDKTTNEGLCIKCAMELNIGPVRQMMENMGITEEDLDDFSEQMEQMMDGMDENFELGGASTFPFMQGIMPFQPGSGKQGEASGEAKQNKRKVPSFVLPDGFSSSWL